ncbi:MAG: AAA family ATPase, partial [Chloroflexota bacterium]
MLCELAIENFAIIERLNICFPAGLSVLTGETGAGKSIIIDALQTALGGRANADMIRAGATLSSVEAIFETSREISASSIAPILRDLGIDAAESLILRREITATGRSTARVNGRAVPVAAMQAIGNILVDIHGQSEHLSILKRDRQLEAIDRYGNLMAQTRDCGDAIVEYDRLRRELNDVLSGQRDATQRADLLRFQIHEIESAGLQPGEGEDLRAEGNRLMHAERLVELAESSYTELTAEHSALDHLALALAATRNLTGIDPLILTVSERLEAAQLEILDLAQELRQYRDSVEGNPIRLEA